MVSVNNGKKLEKDELCRAVIEDELTIYTVGYQKQTLFDQVEECDGLVVDLESVNEIDCAGVQLLLMLKKISAQAQKDLKLVNHSQVVVETLELLNLVAEFGDPVILTAQRGGA